MKMEDSMRRLVVLKIESYDASDTFLHCGNEAQDYLYAITATDERGHAAVVDSSYRTIEEAIEAWPEAAPLTGEMRESGSQ